MEAVQVRLGDPASMAKARTELRSIIAYVEINRVCSRDPINLTTSSHFGRLIASGMPTMPEQIERMDAAVRTVANSASEESIALVSLTRQPQP